MKPADLDRLEIRCRCGGRTERGLARWKNYPIRMWKCKKCGEETYHPLDSQRALELARAARDKQLSVKIRRVGKSLTMTIPSKLAEMFSIREGVTAEWSVDSGNTFRIQVNVRG